MKKVFRILYFTVALSICESAVSAAQEYIKDSLALVDLYNNTDGPNWITKTNWLSTKPISDWYGVRVKNRKVVQILLNYNNLTGTLPESIGSLTYLAVLGLHDNHLSGTIPRSLGNLTVVETVALENNKLSGSLPQSLGNFKNVFSLDLSNNNLTGRIPKTLGQLKTITYLYLNNNNLSGRIPESLDTLRELYGLNLSHNLLTGHVPSFKQKYIGTIDLSYNRLSGNIPKALEKVQLYLLYLSNNKLNGDIPVTLPSTLNILDLSKNNLTGTIPDTIGTFTFLRSLSLSSNELTGKIPVSFKNLTYLEELYLRNNNLTDTLPSFLASLPKLQTLYVQWNHFTFNGMQQLVKHNFEDFKYGFEKPIKINEKNNTLSVYAGGTLNNNTYKWFNNGSLVATITGDSTFTPTASGNYSVEITNSIATELTLKSDTVSFNSFKAITHNRNDQLKLNNSKWLSLSPNPVKDIVTITFCGKGKYTIQLADILGNKLQTLTGIASQDKNTIHVNVSRYAAGVYFITLIDERNMIRTAKLNKSIL